MKKIHYIILFVLLLSILIISTISYSNKSSNNLYLYELIINNNTILSKDDNNSGLYKKNNSYYFKGNVINNYMKINDSLWQILQIDENHNIKLIKETPIDNMKYQFNTEYKNNTYRGSNVYAVLEEYYKSIKNNNIISTDYCISYNNKCLDKEKLLISLPSEADIINTYINEDNTKLSFLNNNNEYWIVSNTSFDKEIQMAYFGYYNDNNQIDYTFVDESNYIRPIITISNKAVGQGEGLKDNPYTVNSN